ncbi:MAG: hypothetical protein ACFE88_13875 [Candidatus Hermodarchaeota archaeon]
MIIVDALGLGIPALLNCHKKKKKIRISEKIKQETIYYSFYRGYWMIFS